jgi:hypothetical protein
LITNLYTLNRVGSLTYSINTPSLPPTVSHCLYPRYRCSHFFCPPNLSTLDWIGTDRWSLQIDLRKLLKRWGHHRLQQLGNKK